VGEEVKFDDIASVPRKMINPGKKILIIHNTMKIQNYFVY